VPVRAAQDLDAADALYRDRANIASARKAADIWAAEISRSSSPEETRRGEGAGGASFDAAWKLARVDYWLGGHAPVNERRKFLENGMEAARKAIAVQPNRPEGHFWLAADMGTLAESFGLRQGLKYRKVIKAELETTLRLDPAFLEGSADRALGRYYFKVPGLFGGSNKEAEAHLRASLKYNPNSTASHYFLAEVLLDSGRKEEGRAELQRVLDAPLDPDWTPEDKEFKEQARALVAKR
jgi:tetratricopeptide (TPR) repeat protein